MSEATLEIQSPATSRTTPNRATRLAGKVIEKTGQVTKGVYDTVKNPNYTFLMLYLDGVDVGLESAFNAMPAGRGAKLREVAAYSVLAYIGSKGNPAVKQKFPIDLQSARRDNPSAVNKSLAELNYQ